MLNKDQISNLIRPINTDIYLVRLIEHWKARILRLRGAPSSTIFIVLLDLLPQKVKRNILGGFL